MAKPTKLKVFRTPIGFHDAFVAAPSQKAALEAWGSQSNLFAQGAAEIVTDPALMKEPLARPGEVVRRLRGSAGEQIEALGPVGVKKSKAPSRARSGTRQEEGERAGKKQGKPPPRPSRAAVDKAEQALAKAEQRHEAALAALRAEEQALQQRRRDVERKQRDERQRLTEDVERARDLYRAAIAEWAG